MSESIILPPVRRSRWRSWIVALLIFAGGAIFGGALTLVVSVRAVQHAIQHPEEAPARIAARLDRKLDLSDAQAEQVKALIAARQRNLQQIRREVQPRVQAELAELESQISDVLTPEQRTRWRTLVAGFRENWLPPPTP